MEFTEVNAEDNPEVAQRLVDEGHRAMPVVVTDNKTWAGMNLPELTNLWS